MGGVVAYFNQDKDKVFSYDTRQIVRIQDRWLFVTLSGLYVILGAFVLFGVFVFGKGYLSFDQARGGIATHVKGDVWATSAGHPDRVRYFSAEDLTYPGLENGNVFVATRASVTKQKRGTCDDESMECNQDSDCSVSLGGTCSAHGKCHELGWCPVEGEEPNEYDLHTGDIQIWIKSFVHFALLDRENARDPMGQQLQAVKPPFIYSNIPENQTEPDRGVNLFSVSELLSKCKPVPVRFEEVAELGVAIEVVFNFPCNYHSRECVPEIKARRLDVLFDPERIGFSFQRSDYLSEDERVLHEMRGVRIFFKAVGRGSMVDVNSGVMKFATTTSLLCLAPIIADLLMLYCGLCFRNHKRYRARKYAQTQVFENYLQQLKQQRVERGQMTGNDESDKLTKAQQAFDKRMREEEDDD